MGKILIVLDLRDFILVLKFFFCKQRKETRFLEGGLWKHVCMVISKHYVR